MMNNINEIENYDALVRRANKIVSEYNRYPLMPKGDCSIDYIKKVFNYNPLFVLDDLKKLLMDTLLKVTEYKYSEEELRPIIDETYGKQEIRHKNRILKTLIENYKHDAQYFRFKHWSYMMLRPEETVIFYYAFSIFYIARDLKNGSALLFARTVLKALDLFYCEKGTNPIDGIEHAGKLLNHSDFYADRIVYEKLMQMIELEIENTSDEETKLKLSEIKQGEKKTRGGCYIATCVYGSYDCPQVWTLRRFRDLSLSRTMLGRLFIKTYYKTSPFVVKLFGENKAFRKMCKVPLDWMIKLLYRHGYSNCPYEDD